MGLSRKTAVLDEKTLQNVAIVIFLLRCRVVAGNIHLSKSGLAMARGGKQKKLAPHIEGALALEKWAKMRIYWDLRATKKMRGILGGLFGARRGAWAYAITTSTWGVKPNL